MTTKIIDKKKLFQLQTVQSKLDNYKQTLTTLLNSRKQLDENLALTNPNYEKVDKLNNDKKIIENTLKDIKSNISKTMNDITKLTYTLKELPLICDANNNNEETILIQEIDRIKIQKDENIKLNDISLNEAHLDKLQLIEDISIIQNSIKEQNNVISDIQLHAHSSRKDILSQLHQKKKTKQDINLQKTQISEQEQFINFQIIELQNIISDLETFKTMLVNDNYNNTTDTIDVLDTSKINLDTYYNKFNIDKEILLNDKIDLINTKIIYNTNKIKTINIKLNKTKLSNDSRLKNIINNYNKNNRVKVLAYKDSFKIEKEKLKYLQNILDTLIYKYDNFENNIINNIKLKLTNDTNELDFDINRANERLIIMKFRNNLNLQTESNRITDEIAILNMKIKEMHNLFNTTNKELQDIIKTIENENIIGIDIAKLDEEIKKYKAMISQNETNIILLSQ